MTTTPCSSGMAGFAAGPKSTQSQDWAEGGEKNRISITEIILRKEKCLKKMPLELTNRKVGAERG